MARDFVAASSDRIIVGDVAALDFTGSFSIAFWVRVGSLAAERKLIAKWSDSDTQYQYLISVVTSGIVQAHIKSAGAFERADTTTAISTNTWYHIAETYDGTNLRVWLNGVNEGTDGSAASPVNTTAPVKIGIGGNAATHENPLQGQMAEIGFWTGIALSTGEVYSLSRGYSPLLIRPSSLVGYFPLIGISSPEPDLRSGNNGTVTGATVYPHPRIIYPSPAQIRRYGATAAPASTFLSHLALMGAG